MNKTRIDRNIASTVWLSIIRAAPLAITLIVGSWNNPTLASFSSSYQDMGCYCDPLSSGTTIKRPEGTVGECSCKTTFWIVGRSNPTSSMNFRFYCKNANAAEDLNYVDTSISGLMCSNASNVGTYLSRSCTNFSSDKVKLTLTTTCHSNPID